MVLVALDLSKASFPHRAVRDSGVDTSRAVRTASGILVAGVRPAAALVARVVVQVGPLPAVAVDLPPAAGHLRLDSERTSLPQYRRFFPLIGEEAAGVSRRSARRKIRESVVSDAG